MPLHEFMAVARSGLWAPVPAEYWATYRNVIFLSIFFVQTMRRRSIGFSQQFLHLNQLRSTFKYPLEAVHPLSANDMILFLFNNVADVDPFVCKKLGHFIFLAFEKRESRSLNIATIIIVSIFHAIIAIIIIVTIYYDKCYFLFFPLP